jgi:hypothetical protein
MMRVRARKVASSSAQTPPGVVYTGLLRKFGGYTNSALIQLPCESLREALTCENARLIVQGARPVITALLNQALTAIELASDGSEIGASVTTVTGEHYEVITLRCLTKPY